MTCKKITFKEKLSETRFLDELDFNEEFKIYVDCPTSGGKSYYILNYLKEKKIKAVFVVDTITLAKQLSAQYEIPYYAADHREDIDADLIITIQHHVTKFESRGTVVIDEAHTLITQIGWKGITIEDVMISLEFYKRIIFLSGTPVISNDSIFKNRKEIKAKKEVPDQRALSIVQYEDLAGGIVELSLLAMNNNKIPVISLLDKSTLLPKVVTELKKRGIKRIAAINSDTKVMKKGNKKECEEDDLIVNDMGAEKKEEETDYLSQLINRCRIEADVIFTTYTQGYSLLGKDNVLIIAPGKNPHTYVDIVQMMNRFREDTSTQSFILTNSIWREDENGDSIYPFPSVFDYLTEQLTTQTRKRIEELNLVARNTRSLKRRLKLLANEYDQYIDITREVNHQNIAFKAFQMINHAMHDQLYKMNNILDFYNIKLYQSYPTTLKIEKEKGKKEQEDKEMKQKEIMEEIDLFYKSREQFTIGCMEKEITLPACSMRVDKNSMQYKIENIHKDLSDLGLQDKEIRELLEKHLHDAKRMNQVVDTMKIKRSTDPTLVVYRSLLLSEFKVGERLKGDEITERMNKLLVKNGMEKHAHNTAVQYFNLLFTTLPHVNKGRVYEIVQTFENQE